MSYLKEFPRCRSLSFGIPFDNDNSRRRQSAPNAVLRRELEAWSREIVGTSMAISDSAVNNTSVYKVCSKSSSFLYKLRKSPKAYLDSKRDQNFVPVRTGSPMQTKLESNCTKTPIDENIENIQAIATGDIQLKSNSCTQTDLFAYSNSSSSRLPSLQSVPNLNVISNVNLSQSTLDVIYDQVMQDVLRNDQNNPKLDPSESKGFYLNVTGTTKLISENKHIVQCMLASVGAGSPCNKSDVTALPSVPRLTAIPRSASMEVKPPIADLVPDDNDCDTHSLADSLEEYPKTTSISSSVQLPKKQSSVFFIPMDKDQPDDFKPVSDHLPEIVRKRLSKRHQAIQQTAALSASRAKSFVVVGDYTDPKLRKRQFNCRNCSTPTQSFPLADIIECIDSSEKMTKNLCKSGSKTSKIPVKSDTKPCKATLNDVELHPNSDPKIDQLIANLLIGAIKGKSESAVDKSSAPYNVSASAPYQGKAAVAVLEDENFASIPKGWLTFYLLHQSSPEHNSSKTGIQDNHKALDSKRNSLPKTSMDSNIVGISKTTMTMTDKHNCSTTLKNPIKIRKDQGTTMTAAGCKQKLFDDNGRSVPTVVNDVTEWSVSVSGTHSHGRYMPEFEMRLKFPAVNADRLDEKGSPLLPAIGDSMEKCMKSRHQSKTHKSRESSPASLPQIVSEKTIKKRKKCGSSKPFKTSYASTIEPRHTKTSTRRILLNQNRTAESNALYITDQRHFAELLPQFLAVTGNTANRTNKPKVTTMRQRYFNKHLMYLPDQNNLI